ncbi:hypothetical protein NA57DRAFT_56183 [Rhizodiscina lignyota]|uniref:Protein kinase domain-containing protein n=1 Tax=Rhizodiscina lignyota TaxID=1504668 RepID=A0A9P4IFU5_9PEZI|nr:hypothetical protein NA57DRAFT_56183 [Rhizodiscina lignyota]
MSPLPSPIQRRYDDEYCQWSYRRYPHAIPTMSLLPLLKEKVTLTSHFLTFLRTKNGYNNSPRHQDNDIVSLGKQNMLLWRYAQLLCAYISIFVHCEGFHLARGAYKMEDWRHLKAPPQHTPLHHRRPGKIVKSPSAAQKVSSQASTAGSGALSTHFISFADPFTHPHFLAPHNFSNQMDQNASSSSSFQTTPPDMFGPSRARRADSFQATPPESDGSSDAIEFKEVIPGDYVSLPSYEYYNPSTPVPFPPPETKVDSFDLHWVVHQRLGAGANGEVFLCQRSRTSPHWLESDAGLFYAVKRSTNGWSSGPNSLFQEFINHKFLLLERGSNCPELKCVLMNGHDSAPENVRPTWISFPWVKGPSLDRLILKRLSLDTPKPLPGAFIFQIMEDLLEFLMWLHKPGQNGRPSGAHCDLHIGNINVDITKAVPRGRYPSVLVLDFGMSEFSDPTIRGQDDKVWERQQEDLEMFGDIVHCAAHCCLRYERDPAFHTMAIGCHHPRRCEGKCALVVDDKSEDLFSPTSEIWHFLMSTTVNRSRYLGTDAERVQKLYALLMPWIEKQKALTFDQKECDEFVDYLHSISAQEPIPRTDVNPRPAKHVSKCKEPKTNKSGKAPYKSKIPLRPRQGVKKAKKTPPKRRSDSELDQLERLFNQK